ncbi:MAG: hypothetical protein HN348_35910, partial [Proteobacteria bacterium]|nr:hypothetical protein [Pseudomonadota bacterium]
LTMRSRSTGYCSPRCPSSTLATNYDLVVVASDADFTSGQVNMVTAANLPILAMGEPGYAFYGELSMDIGYPNGAHNDIDEFDIKNPTHSIFSTPTSVVPTVGSTIQVYTLPINVAKIWLSTVPAGVDFLAADSASTDYGVVTIEDGAYMLWSSDGTPSDMTAIGKDLFVNSVTYMSLQTP